MTSDDFPIVLFLDQVPSGLCGSDAQRAVSQQIANDISKTGPGLDEQVLSVNDLKPFAAYMRTNDWQPRSERLQNF